MKKHCTTLFAWICLGVIALNGLGEIVTVSRSLWRASAPVAHADHHAEESAVPAKGHSCHEEVISLSASCAHCTAACDTAKGHVCGMGGSAPSSGGIAFGIPHCQGIPPSSAEYLPASIGFVFLPPQAAPRVMLLATLETPPSLIEVFTDHSSVPPSPPPEFTIA